MISFESMKRRMQALFSTGKVKQVNDDPPAKNGTPSLQEIQFEALEGELRDKRENYVPYGFTHWPIKDSAEALLLAENGEKAHTIAICIADRVHRLKLNEQGEVALHDDQGQWVWLKREGIEMKGEKITLDGPTTLNGSLKVNGDTDVNGSLKVNGRNVKLH